MTKCTHVNFQDKVLTEGGVLDPLVGVHAGEDSGAAGEGKRDTRGAVPHWRTYCLVFGISDQMFNWCDPVDVQDTG